MIVIFVSECEKKAKNRTKQVLDAFAERIGNSTWKTRITMEGLNAVRILLSKTATRQTAVACHRVIGKISTELMWIVGNKRKFDKNGICPTNYTGNDRLNISEDDYYLLPHIKITAALASLFHDLGKSSDCFQRKLKSNKNIKDPLRHEWVSCALLRQFIADAKTDEEWLEKLVNNGFKIVLEKKKLPSPSEKPLKELPPLASMVLWLILSHHRLPVLFDEPAKKYANSELSGYKKLFSVLSSDFGYKNRSEADRIETCFDFSNGFPEHQELKKHIKRWAAKALEKVDEFKNIVESGLYRVVLQYARICLMLGDHYYSSKEPDENWKTDSKLRANTGFTNGERQLKQFLDEHLTGVTENALQIAQQLPFFENEMPVTENVRHLMKRSSKEFAWQEKAVEALETWRESVKDISKTGFFAINIASTGCGKTLANAKIMRVLSRDGNSLRYILALGLRSLTLQTGEAYRSKIGLNSDELAVMIGSNAIRELFDKENAERNPENISYSESADDILPGILNYDCGVSDDRLSAVIKNEKHRKFLYAPVLACTIDHIMPASESLRGGHHILPSLRLMSSDLVIDEIDDFTGKDLIAISRLVFLAGMFGRKIMLSSATIPPDLALGLFKAYQSGYRIYASSRNFTPVIGCAWVDEFKTTVESLPTNALESILSDYEKIHTGFINARLTKLQSSAVRRRGYIAETCSSDNEAHTEESYFESMKKAIFQLHQNNSEKDPKTDISVSWGVVRMANINPCAALAAYLMNTEWPSDTEIRLMIYHSRQILLMRHIQEKYLDRVFKRKKPDEIFREPVIRRHIDECKTKNLIFILVATPVEEVGRDHDFNWAVVEPSSFRSIIQIAGRVQRHRNNAVNSQNIAVMRFNIRGYKESGVKAFYYPGYEDSSLPFTLKSHDLRELINEKLLSDGINAVPRISCTSTLNEKNSLIDLEHYVLRETFSTSKTGAASPMGWITGEWWLTGISQVLTRFRAGPPPQTLYLIPANADDEQTKFIFKQKEDDGSFSAAERTFNITHSNQEINEKKLWLKRDYYKILYEYSEDGFVSSTAEKYGFIDFTVYDKDSDKFEYSPVYGLTRV